MPQQFVSSKITKKRFSVSKQPCSESYADGQATYLSVKLHKVQNLILYRLQQTFGETFYSKVLSGPNCISKAAATKPGLNFFEIFEKHRLETHLCLLLKFNVHHVRDFYYCVIPIEDGSGLSSEFKN